MRLEVTFETLSRLGTDDAVAREMKRVAKRAFRVLLMRGFGRMDMRLTPENKLFVMEANPNPALAFGEDFPESAEKAGIDYNSLIERIARMALRASHP